MTYTNTIERRAVGAPRLAAQWDVSKQQIYRLIARGDLRALHVGGRVVIPIAEVERYEAEHFREVALADPEADVTKPNRGGR